MCCKDGVIVHRSIHPGPTPISWSHSSDDGHNPAKCDTILAARTHFEVLGVDVGATPEKITKAYKKLMKLLHPDVIQDAILFNNSIAAAYHRVREAYDVLSDEHKREVYKSLLMKEKLETPSEQILTDIVRQTELYGAISTDTLNPKFDKFNGSDIEVDINISNRCDNDKEIKVTFEYNTDCTVCNGTSIRNYAECFPCPQCNGRGSINGDQCLACYGVGYLGWLVCRTCSGKGRVKKKRTLLIRNGINRVKGMGNKGHLGGKDGDLIIRWR